VAASLLQIGDQLVKLVEVLVGHKQVAARPHLRLPSQFNRVEALAVRAFAQHASVVDPIRTVEGKPQGGRSQVVQGREQLAPVGSLRQGNAGRRKRFFDTLPEIMEKSHDLGRLGMGRDLVHGTAAHREVVRIAEAAHFI